jgi:hypothetical protein
MYTSKMTDITLPIQLLGNYREARGLLQVKARWRHEVASCEKIPEFSTDVEVDF